MRYSRRWWVTVAVLYAFAWTVSAPTAQTEEPSSVSAPSSAEVQSDSIEAQPSSDEPEQEQPTLTPNRDTAAAANVEMERRFNELRRELLDDRAKTLDWWLAATTIFLALIGVATAIFGYFGFKSFGRIESEARKNMEASEKHAQEAQSNLEEIKARRDEADSLIKGMNAEVADDDPSKASEVVKNVQQNPDSSLIDRAVSEAILLQRQNRTDEAIEKWHSIANITEGIDDERAAQSWFSIGYLLSTKDDPDLEAVINAYDSALGLNPDYAEVYNNRGVARHALGQYEGAIADYDLALRLNPDYANAYNNRGIARGNLGQHEAAIADFDSALRLNPDYTEAYYNRGIARLGLGQHEAAIADYDAALRLNPNYAKAYYTRGLAELQLNRIDEARQDFERVLNLAQAMGNGGLMEQARFSLEALDRGDAP